MNTFAPKPLVAIACGGTGGHLFPGMAVADALISGGCDILLLVSPKDVDQQAVKNIHGMQVRTLPAFGLSRGQVIKSGIGFLKSFLAVRKLFRERPPQAVLGMGGFTSLAPVLAGKLNRAATFLHEANTVPGKANRWLGRVVDQAFIGFPSAGNRLSTKQVLSTGTPVRPQFQPGDATAARISLGLHPEKPVLLIMGGSQGAAGINELVLGGLPELTRSIPNLQFLHLTGERELEKVQARYREHNCTAVVRPFLTEMELALAAATLAVSRAGASTLAELAAMRLPSILIPFPAAADNHQSYNARALADVGAALMVEQRSTTPEKLAGMIARTIGDPSGLARMKEELVRWHSPRAAQQMAERMLVFIRPLAPSLGQQAKPVEPSETGTAPSLRKGQRPSIAA